MTTQLEVLHKLLALSGAHEGYEVHHYVLYKQSREILVALFDAGAGSEPHRYIASAVSETDKGERRSESSPAATIADAVEGVHWREFD